LEVFRLIPLNIFLIATKLEGAGGAPILSGLFEGHPDGKK